MSDTPTNSNSISPTAPVGQGDYIVQQGDCLSSVALEHGFFWNSLWDLPENSDLKEKRKDPNALLPGDRVTIPDLRENRANCDAGKRYRFRRKGEPTKLVFCMDGADGRPRANVKYRIDIDGVQQEGASDADGLITVRIVGNAKQGVLFFDVDQPEPEEYDLQLGTLDPITSITGVQARLNNLGYDCGEVNGELNAPTQEMLEAFQQINKLPISGKPDQATQDKLLQLHGS